MDLAQRRLSHQASQIDALDGLRGLAVILVFLSHTSLRDWHLIPGLDLRGYGKSGVYLFFILSAFLLSRNLTAKGTDIFARNSVLTYSIRRIMRIYPLYAAYVLLGLIGYYVVQPHLNFTPQFDVAAAREHLLLQEGVFIAWSIPVEFKYYFLLPVVTWVFMRLHQLHFMAAICGFLVLLGLLGIFFPATSADVNDIRTIYYLSIFLTGSYLGVVSVLARPYLIQHRRAWVAVFTIAIILLAWANPSTAQWLTQIERPNNWSHNWHLYFALAWGAFLMAMLFGPRLCRILFEQNVLRFLGLISFSFYLWHFSAIVIIEYYFTDFSNFTKAWLSFALSVIFSTITYYGIEVKASKIFLRK